MGEMGEDREDGEDGEDGEVRSNDFSRFRVTGLKPSNAHVRPCLQSPTQQAVDPRIARVMA